jgi:hypothetical protein
VSVRWVATHDTPCFDCGSCASIDVRRWHREGRLEAGHEFTTVSSSLRTLMLPNGFPP